MTTQKMLKLMIISSISFIGVNSWAVDWFVANTGSDENEGKSAEAPFATVDKAISAAVDADDTIYVAPGTYQTSTKWGPDLYARLVGTGKTRDEVIIESDGNNRTLRTASTAFVTNLTIVGNTDWKADKGGAVEMSGGTIVDCVIKNGTAYNKNNLAGGNIYMSAGMVRDCEIFGGSATNRGGNVYLDNGTISNCVIRGGVSSNVGGNIFAFKGLIADCRISDGHAVNDGGNIRLFSSTAVIADSIIENGTIAAKDKKGSNVYMDGSTALKRCKLIGGKDEYDYDGGSLCIYSSSACAEDCLIRDSECGGILLGGTSYIYNMTVVNNKKYGCWSWNVTQNVYNSIIYNNISDWEGNMPGTNAKFLNCAVGAIYNEEGKMTSRFAEGSYDGLVLLSTNEETKTANFSDFAEGDFRLKKGSNLIDAGIDDPRANASTIDLDGNIRVINKVDIGCYEYLPKDLAVSIAMNYVNNDHIPAEVKFTASVINAVEETTIYEIDFGDGSETFKGESAETTHTYTAPGHYTVTVRATNGDETATQTREKFVPVYGNTVYVNTAATPTIPYDTPETGVKTIAKAMEVHNSAGQGEILIAPGVYESKSQISFSNAYQLRGTGTNPEDVILRNTEANPNSYYYRVMQVENAEARVENLTIENGCVKNQYGGNLRLVSGVVSNCVIRGGRAVVDGSANAGGGGVELAGAGILTHCVISNNVVEGTSRDDAYCGGGGITVAYNAQNGKISNNLVVYNRYVTSTEKSGAAGIRLCGANNEIRIENNTVAANTVEGSLSDNSAGIYCTTWYGRLRNNIVMGNFETGKNMNTAVKMDIEHGTYLNNLTDESEAQSANNFVSAASKVFSDFEHGDFTIKPGCAAYNAGAATTSLALLPSIDIAGNPRIFDKTGKGRIDIGCYECQRNRGFFFSVR